MPTPAIQTLLTDAQQVLNLNSLSEVRATMAAALANANVGTPLNPNLTTQQLWDEFYLIVRQPESDIESIITNQLMKFLYAPPAPGGVGADGQVIFNDGGVLAGDPQFLWNKTTNLLTVTGSATISGDLTVRTNKLAVTSTGVGVGTATPGTACDVASGTVRVKNAVGDLSGLLIYQDTGDASKIFNYYNGSIQFGINNTPAMTLNSTGLGVGGSAIGTNFEAIASSSGSLGGTATVSNIAASAIGNAASFNFRTNANFRSAGYSSARIEAVTPLASNNTDLVFYNYKGVTTSGDESMRITSSGNVGIGGTPQAWNTSYKGVQVGLGAIFYTNAGTPNNGWFGTNTYQNAANITTFIGTGYGMHYRHLFGEHAWLTSTVSGSAGGTATMTQMMTLDASGRLLVAKTSSSTASTGAELQTGAGGNSASVFTADGAFASIMNRLTSDGIVVDLRRQTTSVGNITVTTTGATFNSTSDYRLKEAVAPLSGGLARVNALKPSIYKWKSDGSSGEGFLAHELAEVVPFAVTGEKDAVNEDGSIKSQGVDMSRVVPILVAAIQELTARVQTLEAK